MEQNLMATPRNMQQNLMATPRSMQQNLIATPRNMQQNLMATPRNMEYLIAYLSTPQSLNAEPPGEATVLHIVRTVCA
jgi:hypothetical protein